jgi:serine/threonine protein phosphatase PrpC
MVCFFEVTLSHCAFFAHSLIHTEAQCAVIHFFSSLKASNLCDFQLSTGGGRLIISSDGVWDALSDEVALDCCRGMPVEAAAAQIVKVECYFFHENSN